jgi:hypothetical protein
MIRNPEILKNKFKCNKILAKYLESHGVPLLGMDKNGYYYFAKTNELMNTLKNAPLWRKLINSIF